MKLKLNLIFLILLSSLFFKHSSAFAALAVNSLAGSSSTTDATSYATASITPTGNALVILVVANTFSSNPPTTPTATGNGLTWVQVATEVTANGDAFDNKRLTIFRAMG